MSPRFLAPREVPARRRRGTGRPPASALLQLPRGPPVTVGLRTSRGGCPAPALRHRPGPGCHSLPFGHRFPRTVPWASPCTGQDGLEDLEPGLSGHTRQTRPDTCRAPGRASNRADKDSRPAGPPLPGGHVPPAPRLTHAAFLYPCDSHMLLAVPRAGLDTSARSTSLTSCRFRGQNSSPTSPVVACILRPEASSPHAQAALTLVPCTLSPAGNARPRASSFLCRQGRPRAAAQGPAHGIQGLCQQSY